MAFQRSHRRPGRVDILSGSGERPCMGAFAKYISTRDRCLCNRTHTCRARKPYRRAIQFNDDHCIHRLVDPCNSLDATDRPRALRALLGNPRTAAMLRTTTAATMVSGSPKENVLPIVARGLVNFRILPGDTPEEVLEHVRQTVADTSVHVEGRGREASPVADYSAPEFKVVEKSIGQLFPEAVPVPFLMIGGTDTRHYEGLTRNVYRFNPIVATTEMVSGAHGTNERVRADDFVRAARFFAQLIRNTQ